MGDGWGDGSGRVGPEGRRLVFLAVFPLMCFFFFSLCFLFSSLLVGGSPAPGDMRTAHLRRAKGTCGTNFFASATCFRHISLWDDAFVLLRELNK
jgi:hypothetical protein